MTKNSISDYDCHLKVTEARPLLDYMLSTMSSAAEKLQADQGKVFYRYVDQLIRKSGGILITKETGYFKAMNL